MMKSLIMVSLFALPALTFAQKFEAENGSLTGTAVANSRAGFSGDGYVTGFDNAGDAVSIKVSVSSAGLYALWIGYAAPNGEKANDVYVNGAFAGSALFPASQTFEDTYFGKINLEAGDNRIKIVKDWGYFDVDYVRVSPASPNEIHHYSTTLVHPDPSYEAETLYLFLRDYYGHRIISGQQANAGGDAEVDFLFEKTGKRPAMKGFDLIDYSPSRVERGTTSRETELSVEWWQEHGGIVSMIWHWNAPKDLLDTEDAKWWSGFYTAATTFDPGIAMNDQTSEEYGLIIRDIDVIAEELLETQEANVPLLWRPLHEAEGGWFWWGSKGPEVAVWLWKLMYDRLTNHHGLDNLIWVWTGTNSPEALDWYPGDAYVDIIGADIYLQDKNYSSGFSMFDDLAGIHEGKKVITLSETGTIPDPDDMEDHRARWSWFSVWSGDFILDGVKNEVAHINKVYNHEYVVTLDELPDFYNYVSPDFPDVVLAAPWQQVSARVYPNPTSDYLHIESADAIRQIKMYDLRGGEVSVSPTGTGGQKSIDLSRLDRGVYLMRMVTETGIKGFKVVKE